MNCASCGTQFESKFCPNCGAGAPESGAEDAPITYRDKTGKILDLSAVLGLCGNRQGAKYMLELVTFYTDSEIERIIDYAVHHVTPKTFSPKEASELCRDIELSYMDQNILKSAKRKIATGLSVFAFGGIAFMALMFISASTHSTSTFSFSIVMLLLCGVGCIVQYLSYQDPRKFIANMQYKVTRQNVQDSQQKSTASEPRQRPQTKGERKRENRANGVACCPKCGSASLSANKKGFGIGKAVIGDWAFGPIGMVAGNINARKLWVTCLNCGHRWKT